MISRERHSWALTLPPVNTHLEDMKQNLVTSRAECGHEGSSMLISIIIEAVPVS